MPIFKKKENTLKEVKQGIRKYGKFDHSLQGWQTVKVSEDLLVVITKDKYITYKNVHGSFGFPTVLL